MLPIVPAFDRIGEENAFAVLARATELPAQGRDIINLGIGQPDFPTPPHIVEAAVKALRDGHHGYTPATGIQPLREAVAADIHQRLGVEVSPDEVMIVPGGKVTMFIAILMFGEPGAEILYPDPGFPIYRSMIEFTGATPVPMPIREENGFAFSAEETLGADHAEDPPHHPQFAGQPDRRRHARRPRSTRSSPASPASRMSRSCRTRSMAQMTYDGLPHVSLLTYPEIRDRLILLDGWSKTYAMTGWRMGFSVWPKPLYDNVRKLAVNAYSCVNAPAQWAGLAALDRAAGLRSHAMVAEFDQRRQIVVEGLNRLPGISCITPKGAFYAFPNIIADRLEGEGARLGASRGGRRRHHRRPRFRRPRRGLSPPLLRQLGGEHPRALERMGEFLASRKAA